MVSALTFITLGALGAGCAHQKQNLAKPDIGPEQLNLTAARTHHFNPAVNPAQVIAPTVTPEISRVVKSKGASRSLASAPALVPVYRFFSPNGGGGGVRGEHFFTLSNTEVSTSHGWIAEGIGFYVLGTADAGTSGLYRCYETANGFHFVSRDSNCEGYKNEGLYGYVYTSQMSGTTPLLRFYNGDGDHMETLNPTEIDATVGKGWRFEGISGFTPQNPVVTSPVASVPVYRFFSPNGGGGGVAGEHFYTLSNTEVSTSHGWVAEGIGFYVLSDPDTGTTGLYRCYESGHGWHFVSTDPGCEGNKTEGRYGYVHTAQTAGFAPLYRYYNSGGDHLETESATEINASELATGWRSEGISGYVPESADTTFTVTSAQCTSTFNSSYTAGVTSATTIASSDASTSTANGTTAGTAAGTAAGLAMTPAQGTADGQSAGYTDGYNNTYTGSYNTAYNHQYTVGNSAGTTAGANDAASINEGATAGQNAGYNDGLAAGAHDAYNDGYNLGYSNGESAGWTAGDNAGYTAGQSDGYTYGYNADYPGGYSDGQATCSGSRIAPPANSSHAPVFGNSGKLGKSSSNSTLSTQNSCPVIGSLNGWTLNPSVHTDTDAQAFCFQLGCSTIPDPSSADYNSAYASAYATALAAHDGPYMNTYNVAYAHAYPTGQAAGTSAGITNGNTDGYNAGYTAGYNAAKTVAYNNAYNNAYNPGYNTGYSDGYNNTTNYNDGYASGHYDGYNNNSYGYNAGYSVGYTSGYNTGEASGDTDGYNKGYSDGVATCSAGIANPAAGKARLMAPAHSFASAPPAKTIAQRADIVKRLSSGEKPLPKTLPAEEAAQLKAEITQLRETLKAKAAAAKGK